MIKQLVSANEIETKKAEGWVLTGEQTVIAGKLRTAEMQKDGDPMGWLEEDNRIKREAVAQMSKTEKRMHFQRSALYARGLD